MLRFLSKVALYKINSKKLVAIFYTTDKWVEREIRETIPYTIVTDNIKYIGVIINKQEKDLYDKNFKFLKKEIEEAIRSRKDLTC